MHRAHDIKKMRNRLRYAYSHLTKINIYVHAYSVITSNKDKHIRIFGQKTNIYVYA